MIPKHLQSWFIRKIPKEELINSINKVIEDWYDNCISPHDYGNGYSVGACAQYNEQRDEQEFKIIIRTFGKRKESK